MRWRTTFFAIFACLLAGLLPADEAPRGFRRLEIEAPCFTHDQVGLIHLECEKIATYLSVYAYRNFREGILAQSAEARVRARRFLSLALNLDPHNVAAEKINDLLAEGKAWPDEIALPQEPKHFVAFAMTLARRLKPSAAPAAQRLAGFLCLVAAEIDPSNEDAVYEAEIYMRDTANLRQAWKDLAVGRPKQ